MIRIPEAPEEVRKCVLTKGDQVNEEFTALGQSHFIPLQVVHPRNNKEALNITAMVNGIKTCLTTTTTPITTTSFLDTNSNSIPKIGGVHSGIVFGSSALGTILVVALFSTAVCFLKRRKTTAIAQLKDVNPTYGEVYYHLDK